ncbi:plastidic glucose transporter 4 [Tanacetum coccineum]
MHADVFRYQYINDMLVRMLVYSGVNASSAYVNHHDLHKPVFSKEILNKIIASTAYRNLRILVGLSLTRVCFVCFLDDVDDLLALEAGDAFCVIVFFFGVLTLFSGPLAVIGNVLYVLSFSLGAGPVPVLLLPEIFASRIRAKAVALSLCMHSSIVVDTMGAIVGGY